MYLVPPSPRQLEYINHINVFNVLEGAVRSGKTILNINAFATNLEQAPEELHLASAVSIGNAKTIIGDSNGYGLAHIYKGRCKYTSYRDKEALRIDTFTNGRKYVIFAGGQKSKDDDNIVGMSFGSWIATEIDRHHENFVAEALSRLAIARQMRVYWDLNPNVPSHYIYKKYIDLYRETKPHLINYQQLTMFDNRAFTEQQLELFLANYQEGSMWYRRDILGERISLTGSIYPNFDHKKHLNNITKLHKPFVRYFIGMDWGYSGSATAFILVGEHIDGSVQVLDEFYDNSDMRSAQDNLKQALDFIDKHRHYYPVVYPDSADVGMLRDLQRAYPMVHNFGKPKIQDRIRLLDKLLVLDAIKINSVCQHVISSLDNAVFDKMSMYNLRLDNGTYNVDSLDALEYALTDIFVRMERDELTILHK